MQFSRAGKMIKNHIENMPPMEMIQIDSDTLDGRMEHLMDEIENGIMDPAIHQLVSKILKEYNVPARDWKGEAQAVFSWVRENIRYTRDPDGLELFQKPIRTVQLGKGDCDDYSILISSLLGSIGHTLILRVIGVSSNQPEHIYPIDLIPADDPVEALALDATRDEPIGWQVSEKQMLFREDYELNLGDE